MRVAAGRGFRRGRAARAAEGGLTFLASGSAAAFAKARPALDAMAGTLYELGDARGHHRYRPVSSITIAQQAAISTR